MFEAVKRATVFDLHFIRPGERNVTAGDVVTAIRANNFLSTPGKTQNDFVAYSLEMQTTSDRCSARIGTRTRSRVAQGAGTDSPSP